MIRMAWCLLLLLLAGMVIVLAPQPAAAQEGAAGGGEYTNVSGLTPYATEADYMSLPGYLRWQTYLEQKVWISVPEAKRIVAEQLGQ